MPGLTLIFMSQRKSEPGREPAGSSHEGTPDSLPAGPPGVVQRSELQTVTSRVLFAETEKNLGSPEPERVWGRRVNAGENGGGRGGEGTGSVRPRGGTRRVGGTLDGLTATPDAPVTPRGTLDPGHPLPVSSLQ